MLWRKLLLFKVKQVVGVRGHSRDIFSVKITGRRGFDLNLFFADHVKIHFLLNLQSIRWSKFAGIIFRVNLKASFLFQQIVNMDRVRCPRVKYFAQLLILVFRRLGLTLCSNSASCKHFILLDLRDSLKGLFDNYILDQLLFVKTKPIFLSTLILVFSRFKLVEEIKFRVLFILSIERSTRHNHRAVRNRGVVDFRVEALGSILASFASHRLWIFISWRVRTHQGVLKLLISILMWFFILLKHVKSHRSFFLHLLHVHIKWIRLIRAFYQLEILIVIKLCGLIDSHFNRSINFDTE